MITGMAIRPDVVRRILLAKSILSASQAAPWHEPDPHTVAQQVLAAHDASDLVFAAIADHQGRLDKAAKKAPSMPDCLDLINLEDGESKPAVYFRDLNYARNSLKHVGLLPSTQQWAHVGRETYEKLSDLCGRCLGLTLNDLDDSELLLNPEAKAHFVAAKAATGAGDYRRALEELGKALYVLLHSNPALSRAGVGEASAENAIMLSGFGVDANTFLRLQEFLPKVFRLGSAPFDVTWAQSKFGHPGNWREEVAGFCLQAFLQIGPRIQEARWIPLPVELWDLYDYRVTAKEEDVRIWEECHSVTLGFQFAQTKREAGKLAKGESVVVSAARQPLVTDWQDQTTGSVDKVVMLPVSGSGLIASILAPRRFVVFDKVAITCVPRDLASIREFFPGLDLAEMPWAEDDTTTED
ncbi:MAG TPA: hypothetical protein VNJ52_08490 [Patescibacteria group bacterium]|nr:hypothetical protein [Patescibacteria group bacterium]